MSPNMRKGVIARKGTDRIVCIKLLNDLYFNCTFRLTLCMLGNLHDFVVC